MSEVLHEAHTDFIHPSTETDATVQAQEEENDNPQVSISKTKNTLHAYFRKNASTEDAQEQENQVDDPHQRPARRRRVDTDHHFLRLVLISPCLVQHSKPKPYHAISHTFTASVQKKQHHDRNALVCREINGVLSPWTAAHSSALATSAYQETCFVDAHPWRTPILGAIRPSPLSGYIQCAQFDGTGELLVTGSDDGTILVHSGESLQHTNITAVACSASTTSTSKRNQKPMAPPLLALRSSLHKIHHIKWNPLNENVIAVSCKTSRDILLYDLQRTQGRPMTTLSLPTSCSSGGAGDMAFFSSPSPTSYSLAVGGPSGQVCLWDLRSPSRSSTATTTLQSTRGGTITSVSASENDHLVIAATSSGDIKAWDLRGGRAGSALRFGGTSVHHHPLLTTITLSHALTAVPGLLEQAGAIPPCAIHSLSLNPISPYRAGFHLGCGWSGVYDLYTRQITHIHAPSHDKQTPSLATEGGEHEGLPRVEDGATATVAWTQMTAPSLTRHGCWSGDGRRYMVPSRVQDALMILDFDENRHSGGYSLVVEKDDEEKEGEEEEDEEVGGGGSVRSKRPPSAVYVPLSQTAICAAAMPCSSYRNGEVFVAAGAHNLLSVISLAQSNRKEGEEGVAL